MKLPRTILYLFLSLLQLPLAQAQTAMQNVLGRERLSLNGTWNILPDQFGVGGSGWGTSPEEHTFTNLAQIYYEEGETLEVPSDWNSQRPEFFYFEGNIWYKKSFYYTPEDDKRAFLHFAGVSMHCDVYLNRKKIGSHKGGFTPFQFEVGELLNEGRNYVIVRVDNLRGANTIPALSFDWWNYGGITRDVDIVSVPKTYINDYKISLNNDDSKLIDIMVKLDGEEHANKEVTIAIPEVNFRATLTTDSDGVATASKKANRLELWSPESPKIYDVFVSTQDDSIEDNIGFRNIEVRGEDILLNGKPIYLRGINIHEEIADEKRRSTNLDDASALLDQAEALGCNFIRLSHYPHNEYMVREAERRGFLMWEEVPLWQRINFSDPEVCAYGESMTHEMIQRDKNRCGIIFWSIANETFPNAKGRDEYLINIAHKVKEWDPSRLVTSALHMAEVEQRDGKNVMVLNDPLIEHLDVVGNNKYMGWYLMFPCDPAEFIWDIAPGKPLIMSEWGAECVYGNLEGDPKDLNSWSEMYMAQAYRDNLMSFENAKNLRGISPWILYDFRSPQRPHAKFQAGWNRKGLMSPEGGRKQAWYILRDYYQQVKNGEK